MTRRTSYLPEPDFAHTPEAKSNRLDKADRLAQFMLDTRIPRMPSGSERRDIERAAGVRRASDETWLTALEIWQANR